MRLILQLFILFTPQFNAFKCSISTHRNGINIYEWREIEHGICNIPLNTPFIIQNSSLKSWSKSTMKHILNLIKTLSTKVRYQLSDCNCFNNNNICMDYINSFLYSSQQLANKFGNRIDSIWYKYEINYNLNKKYLKCIQTKTKTMQHKDALKALKL
eukprot:270951_1